MSAALSFALARLPLSTVKTLTYGVMHFCVAATVAYILTGSFAAALSIGIIEPFVQTFFYNMHERAWSRVADLPPADIGHGH
ncbi:MAG: DUF2061 domain-containing protein [Parvularculaceae bacterium]|nr:DUF2061 domain-containing protein [Parvularculaceae bacterium]